MQSIGNQCDVPRMIQAIFFVKRMPGLHAGRVSPQP
jgi:hypothetical protein